MFSSAFLREVNALALEIAKQRRGEDHLQPVATLAQKFDAEMVELAEADHAWDELPDVTYYAACLWLQGDESRIPALKEVQAIFGVTMAQLERATLAKYRLRAKQPKDILVERAAILAAIQ